VTEKASSEAALWLTALGRGVYCALQRRNKSELGHCALPLVHLLLATSSLCGGWGWAAATEMFVSRVIAGIAWEDVGARHTPCFEPAL